MLVKNGRRKLQTHDQGRGRVRDLFSLFKANPMRPVANASQGTYQVKQLEAESRGSVRLVKCKHKGNLFIFWIPALAQVSRTKPERFAGCWGKQVSFVLLQGQSVSACSPPLNQVTLQWLHVWVRTPYTVGPVGAGHTWLRNIQALPLLDIVCIWCMSINHVRGGTLFRFAAKR